MAMTGRVCLIGFALAFLAFGAGAEEARLHVYNWSDYIAPDTIANFEKETGIAVTYDVYDGNEVLEAKLLAGRSGYDIVVPSASPFMARQIVAGAYLPLDKSKLPNLRNLDPRIVVLAATADPGNRHGVPYLWSVTGIGYNVAMVERARQAVPRDSLALIFDPCSPPGSPRHEAPKHPAGGDAGSARYLELAPTAQGAVRPGSTARPGPPYVRRFRSRNHQRPPRAISASLGYSGDVIRRTTGRVSGAEIAFRVPRRRRYCRHAASPLTPHPRQRASFHQLYPAPGGHRAISDTVPTPNRRRPRSSRRIRDDPGYPLTPCAGCLSTGQAALSGRGASRNRMKSGC
jgi:putrescine transport system substrate-binding protein